MTVHKHEPAIDSAASATRIAMLARISADGVPWRRRPDGGEMRARVLAQVARIDLDRALDQAIPLLIACEDGDRTLPIILGLVALSAPAPIEPAPVVDKVAGVMSVVTEDGGVVTITGKERLVLRCGEASVSLTSSGEVIIDGAYVASISSGVNKIRGGQVRIN